MAQRRVNRSAIGAVLLLCHSLSTSALNLRFIGVGKYAAVEGSCAFCSQESSELQFSEVLPVPVEDGFLDLLDRPSASKASLLATRDGGLWDNLPFDAATLAKRDALFELERRVNGGEKLFEALEAVVLEFCQVSILSAQVEDASRGNAPSNVVLGGAVFIAQENGPARLVETYAEEAIALATGLRLPLTCDDDLFEAASARVESFQVNSKGRLRIEAELPKGLPREAPPSGMGSAPAWELRSAEDWLALTFPQKVAVAVASGVSPPRRARGEEALDKVLVPLLDEDVRRDVKIMQAMRQGDMQEVARLTDERSRRGELRNKLRMAVAEENYSRAAELQKQLNLLDRGKADTTQDEGSYDRFLDADPWYLDNLES